jgi:hypothetical protein
MKRKNLVQNKFTKLFLLILNILILISFIPLTSADWIWIASGEIEISFTITGESNEPEIPTPLSITETDYIFEITENKTTEKSIREINKVNEITDDTKTKTIISENNNSNLNEITDFSNYPKNKDKPKSYFFLIPVILIQLIAILSTIILVLVAVKK